MTHPMPVMVQRQLSPGQAIAEALALARPNAVLVFTANREEVAGIRTSANEWLERRHPGKRISIFRTEPNTGRTYELTEWNAWLVPRGKEITA